MSQSTIYLKIAQNIVVYGRAEESIIKLQTFSPSLETLKDIDLFATSTHSYSHGYVSPVMTQHWLQARSEETEEL